MVDIESIQFRQLKPQQGQAILVWPDGAWQICNPRLAELLIALGLRLSIAASDAEVLTTEKQAVEG